MIKLFAILMTASLLVISLNFLALSDEARPYPDVPEPTSIEIEL
ncbi:hypothetical protein [Evansella halocellulosilytica]|nr:hypothetical protein [Evansella halocellulosilytica]